MRRELGICLVLAITTLLVYGQVVGFDFVNFDDLNYVVENPHVAGGVSASNIGWAFTTGYEANWHPVTWLSLMLDAELFGPSATGFRATNLALHAGSSVLLFLALAAMTGRFWPCLLAAALSALMKPRASWMPSI